MHKKGVETLLSGNFALWGGVTEAMKNSFIVAYLLDPEPLFGLVRDLHDLEEKTGVKLVLATRDFPPHVTLQQGAGQVPSDLRMPMDVGQPVFMADHLIVGPNVLLAASDIPESVIEHRMKISQWMEIRSLIPSPIDILHSTVARIIGMSHGASLAEFNNELLAMRVAVTARPIQLRAKGVFLGTVADLLSAK